jgi:hypothetical protein
MIDDVKIILFGILSLLFIFLLVLVFIKKGVFSFFIACDCHVRCSIDQVKNDAPEGVYN